MSSGTGILLRYTLARLALFAAAFGLVWLVGGTWLVWDLVSVLWTALVALAVSAIASFVLLRGLRDELAERFAESQRSEDA